MRTLRPEFDAMLSNITLTSRCLIIPPLLWWPSPLWCKSLTNWKFVLKAKPNRYTGLLMTALKIVMLLLGISLLHFMVTLMREVLLQLNYSILNNALTKIWILLCQISLYWPIRLFPLIRILLRSKPRKLFLRVAFTNLKLILYSRWVNVPL